MRGLLWWPSSHPVPTLTCTFWTVSFLLHVSITHDEASPRMVGAGESNTRTVKATLLHCTHHSHTNTHFSHHGRYCCRTAIHAHTHTRSHTAIPKFPYTGPGSGVMMIPLPKCLPPCLLETAERGKKGGQQSPSRNTQIATTLHTQPHSLQLAHAPLFTSYPALWDRPIRFLRLLLLHNTPLHTGNTQARTHARTYVTSPSNIGRRDTDDGCFR